jgi:hypothetical protein
MLQTRRDSRLSACAGQVPSFHVLSPWEDHRSIPGQGCDRSHRKSNWSLIGVGRKTGSFQEDPFPTSNDYLREKGSTAACYTCLNIRACYRARRRLGTGARMRRSKSRVLRRQSELCGMAENHGKFSNTMTSSRGLSSLLLKSSCTSAHFGPGFSTVCRYMLVARQYPKGTIGPSLQLFTYCAPHP